jgi:hypothetical protein
MHEKRTVTQIALRLVHRGNATACQQPINAIDALGSGDAQHDVQSVTGS